MLPKLFELPFLGWPINSYGFSIMVGFLLASWICVKRAKPLGIKSDFILDVGIIAMIFGILGAKVNYLLQYPDSWAPLEGQLSIFGDPGLSPLGGIILGPLPFGLWWWRMRKKEKDPAPIKLYTWRTGILLALTLLCALLGTRMLYLYEHREG